MTKNIIDIDALNFEKNNGLITAVVQDCVSGTVLMVGHQNREACEKTSESGQVTFWSRTKNRLWTKGETSGNFLNIKSLKIDCDQDAILYLVEAPESTWHTGSFSCFGASQSFGVLSSLFELIESRKKEMPEGSYTASLFKEGLDRMVQKVGEEAVETVIAAKNDDREDFLNESSDLLFHFLVLCAGKDVKFEDVLKKLKGRS